MAWRSSPKKDVRALSRALPHGVVSLDISYFSRAIQWCRQMAKPDAQISALRFKSGVCASMVFLDANFEFVQLFLGCSPLVPP